MIIWRGLEKRWGDDSWFLSDPRPAAAAPGGAAGCEPGPEEGHQGPILSGSSGGDSGADVRTAVRGSDERFPPRPAAEAAGQTQLELPVRGGDPERQQDAPPGQPAERFPLGLQVRAGQEWAVCGASSHRIPK